ncbi:MAG: cyclase family protein [Desulfobacterales bacterium]
MKILDISIPVSPEMPVWPGDPRVVLEQYRTISPVNHSNDSKLACSVHTGTHVDAPAHFIENGKTVENLSLNMLIGPAVVADLPEADIITPELLDALALAPQTTRLLLKTRNSALWTDPHHDFHQDFVALSPDAARWIIRHGIGLVGIDYLSIQMFKDTEPLTHRTLLDAGVIIVEGLNLQEVAPGNYQLICLPVKLAGSDGAPTRAVLIEK